MGSHIGAHKYFHPRFDESSRTMERRTRMAILHENSRVSVSACVPVASANNFVQMPDTNMPTTMATVVAIPRSVLQSNVELEDILNLGLLVDQTHTAQKSTKQQCRVFPGDVNSDKIPPGLE